MKHCVKRHTKKCQLQRRRLLSTKRTHRENEASVHMVTIQFFVFFRDFPPSTHAPFIGLYVVCFQNTGNSVLFCSSYSVRV